MPRLALALGAVLVLAAFSAILAEWAGYVSQVSRLSHSLLVPGLAGILAWLAHARAERPLPSPAPGASLGALLLAMGGALLIVGSLSGIFTLSIAGFPIAVAGLVGSFGGIPALRRFGYALLLLLAMVPPPLPLLDRITPFMVQASGDTAVFMLRLLEADGVQWIGNELDFRGWKLIVAEACSGSGTLLVLGTLTLFVGGLFQMRPLALGVTLLLVAPLTLFLNGLRIALTAVILDGFGPEAVAGSAHEALGQVVVILGGVALAWAVDRITSRRARVATPPPGPEAA